MPPRKRVTADDADPKVTEVIEGHAEAEATPEPPASTRKKATPAVCPECFPAGAPEGATAVGCEHGSWPL